MTSNLNAALNQRTHQRAEKIQGGIAHAGRLVGRRKNEREISELDAPGPVVLAPALKRVRRFVVGRLACPFAGAAASDGWSGRQRIHSTV